MTTPSTGAWLTADLKACARCGVTQSRTVLRPEATLRALVGGREMGLSKPVGSDRFERDPRQPPDRHTDAEVAAFEAQPWYCREVERCTRHQIDRALQVTQPRPPPFVGLPLVPVTKAKRVKKRRAKR